MSRTSDLFRWRLTAVLLANALLRLANAASGALIGLYLAFLATNGRLIDAALVGTLGVVVSSTELLGAIPLGILADRFTPRSLLVWSGLLGAISTQLFGISGLVVIFYLSRAMEGVAAAASGPSLLAHLTDVTQGKTAVRGRVMSLFELSLLVGLAFGTLVAGLLWESVAVQSFSWIAAIYLVVTVLFWFGAVAPETGQIEFQHPLAGLKAAVATPALRRLAPAWVAANAVAGLWLTHIVFQLTGPKADGQYLVGLLTAEQIAWISVVYALVFALGIVIWSFFLDRLGHYRVMVWGVWGMFGTGLCFYLLNHSADWTVGGRTAVLVFYAFMIMLQSGFTPAALAFLVNVAGEQEGRGATMGIYTLLLGLGNAVGAGWGGLLASRWFLDGLLLGTAVLGVIGFLSLQWLGRWQKQTT
ncbi:MAG: MFS transporter [Chloroflexota bacterium]